jgi:hypothetical protein
VRLFDLYKHKESSKIIEIIGFATPMGEFPAETLKVVFQEIVLFGYKARYLTHNMGYGTENEIEKEYDFAMSNDEAYKIGEWKDIMREIRGDIQ